MSDLNEVWNGTTEQNSERWKEAIDSNMALKASLSDLNARLSEQQRLIDSWKQEVEKLTLDNHILREELARERAPKQDIR